MALLTKKGKLFGQRDNLFYKSSVSIIKRGTSKSWTADNEQQHHVIHQASGYLNNLCYFQITTSWLQQKKKN